MELGSQSNVSKILMIRWKIVCRHYGEKKYILENSQEEKTSYRFVLVTSLYRHEFEKKKLKYIFGNKGFRGSWSLCEQRAKEVTEQSEVENSWVLGGARKGGGLIPPRNYDMLQN